MERLTRSNINVDPDTDRFLHATIGGKEIDWKQNRDSTLNVLINGPTSNGFGKDIFRKMARDLYGRLKAYEDTGWTPEMLHKLGENAGHLWDFAQAAENMTVGRLKELAEADKDGRLVVLPCKGIDKLYVVGTKQIVECNVAEMYLMDDETIEYLVNFECVDNCDGCPFNSWERETVSDEYHCGGEYGDGSVSSKDFGKTVFLTSEEAEKALQEMEGKS